MPWQSLYHRLFDTMQEGVVYQDADGTIVSMNPAAERILGRTRDEFLGQSSVSVEHDTLREDGSPFPGLEHPAMVALRTGREVRDVLMQVYNPREQRYRCISITAMPLFREGEDTPYQVYTIFDDITERRAAEARLRETQQLTGALNHINETIHASLDIDEIMQRLVGEGAAALGSDTAAISLRRAGRWTVSHVHGLPDSLVGAEMRDDEERHAMLALHTRRPVAIADAFNDDRVNCEHMRRHNVRAVLVAPLIVRDEPFGAIFFSYHSGPHSFSEAQVQFAAQLAATAAIALENGRLYQERKQDAGQLRTTLESIGDGFFACDADWRFVYVNAQAERILGIQREQVLGKSHWEAFPLTLGTRLEREYRRAAAGEVRDFENFYEPWDRWFHNRCFPREGGGMSVYFEDITERKQNTEKIRQQNTLLQAINRILEATLAAATEEELGGTCLAVVEGTTGGRFGFIGEIGTDGLLHDIAISDFGWEACQMTSVGGHRRPPGNFQIHGIYGRVLLDGKGFSTNEPESHPDRIGTPPGHPPLTSFLGVPLVRNERTIGMVAVANREGGFDKEQLEALEAMAPAIAEAFLRKRMEAEAEERTAKLQASEERFRQLAENIDDVFWMLDLDTQQLLYVSPAYEAICGRSLQDLYQQPRSFLDTIHPDDRIEVGQELTAYWQAYDREFRILRPDGTARWIRLRTFPVYNACGEIYRLAGVAADRTEQRATQVALIQAERLTAAGKLAASLAHEINNPLQSVIGCLGLAQRALEKRTDPGTYLQVAHEEVRRTVQIVSRLRALGRPLQEGPKVPTDLNSLLNDVLVLNKKHLQTQKIDVIWEPDTGLPPVPLMPDPMRQVFMNLVINAADAMPEGGQLRLRTERTESPAGVQVAVADTGTGIPPGALPHIFEAFYSTKSEGLGVGLFVSQSIVQQHGGHIAAKSRPGAGTTFTVWLPA
jgi:PAS domain S-box-containing protein